jgi:two-component system OmpR family sensor kinase
VTIRLRLTLVYSALLALTLVVFGGALYLTVERVMLGVVRGTLEDEAQRLVDGRFQRGQGILLPVSRFGAPETYVQTRDPGGNVTDRTANLAEVVLPFSPEAQAAVRAGETWSEQAVLEGGRFLVLSRSVPLGERSVGTLQVARSLAEQERALATLRTGLAASSVLVVALAFGAGWLLAGLALRPIDQVTRTAEAIGREQSFDRRVAYEGPRDELGRLATTFNEMLGRLQAAYGQAEAALDAQRRFVADASHELRTPLTTLRGNLGLLTREPPIAAEDRREVLADMVSESDRLIRLVNDLLLLARGAGRAPRRHPVELAPLVEDVCRQAARTSPDRPLRCDVPELTAAADPDALRQVLVILLDNAFKHTPPEAAVEVEAAALGAEELELVVRDWGPGISPTALLHVTERFYRGDAARSTGGAGLGLAIAKALAEAQGGSLVVESRPGHGTAVRVRLPRASRLELAA